MLKHAVQRGIEIISEASRALPDVIIWGVVSDELPRLREAVTWLQQNAPADDS